MKKMVDDACQILSGAWLEDIEITFYTSKTKICRPRLIQAKLSKTNFLMQR
jgi:hypothetical protein